MSDIESDDVIDWKVTPRDELRFALELDPKDLAGTPVSHEFALTAPGNLPPDSTFTVRFKNGQVAPPFSGDGRRGLGAGRPAMSGGYHLAGWGR